MPLLRVRDDQVLPCDAGEWWRWEGVGGLWWEHGGRDDGTDHDSSDENFTRKNKSEGRSESKDKKFRVQNFPAIDTM